MINYTYVLWFKKLLKHEILINTKQNN